MQAALKEFCGFVGRSDNWTRIDVYQFEYESFINSLTLY
jgi:hypothetical protein